jgi:hypothetical protein
MYGEKFYNAKNQDHSDEKILQGIKTVCKASISILTYLKNSSWLSDRSLVVRYEDLAMNPAEIAQKILEHAGLEFSDEVKLWIEQNTKEKNY